jgi:hypothetical protein
VHIVARGRTEKHRGAGNIVPFAPAMDRFLCFLNSAMPTHRTWERRLWSDFGRLLFSASFQSGRPVVESWLNIHNTELAVFAFAMRSHCPQKTNAVAGN